MNIQTWCWEEIINGQIIFILKFHGEIPQETFKIVIKINLGDIGCERVNWFEFTKDKNFMKNAMNFLVP